MIPVFVINLRRSTDRAASIKAHLDKLGVAFTFFEAVDGMTMPDTVSETLGVRPYAGRRRLLSAGEIACAASHLAACRLVAERDYEFACVLEDDVRFFPEAVAFLDEANLRAIPRFDVLSLQGFNGHLVLPVSSVGGTPIYAPLRSRSGTVAQIYSRGGARKIAAAKIALDSPIDHYVYLSGRIGGLRLLNVRPAAVSSGRGQSTIAGRKKKVDEGKSNRRSASLQTEVERVTGLLGDRGRQFGSFLRAWGLSSLARIRVVPNGARPHQRHV